MSWKKNAISYIMWFLYVLITEALVLTCADELAGKAGLSVYAGVLLAFAFVTLIGVMVLLIRRLLKGYVSVWEKRKLLGLIAEAVLCVSLLAVGLWLRISGLDVVTQSAAYFETAQVTYGQSIPQVVHGAEYMYLQVLHGLFVLVGNHFMAGIWLQIGLQMLAFFALYFVVKRLAGTIAALITLAFGMCAPFFVQYALTLSPEMLYFLLIVLVLAIFMIDYGKKIRPALFLIFGGLAAVMTYLDIAGVFLFLFAAAMPFAIRQEKSVFGKKMAALGCTVVSYVGIFAGTILVDAILSGKIFGNVLKAWAELYSFKTYAVSNTPFSVEEIILLGLLVVGIFSFWCHKQEEIISVSMCNVIVLIALSLRFTEEMPGELYCIMMLVIMAGSFVGQVFAPGKAVVAMAENVVDSDETMMGYEEVPESIEVDVNEKSAVHESVPETVVDETMQEQATPVIQFIENPLPLPKKHEKKVLDYAVELTDETAEFDIDVADEDDYDN